MNRTSNNNESWNGRVNVKFTVEQATKTRGEKRYSSTVPLTSALDGVGGMPPYPT
jgi:hypothetical protein